MKVKNIKTGEILTVNDSYGLRMITQGQAIPVDEKKISKKGAAADGAGEK